MIGQILLILKGLLEGNPTIIAVTNGIETVEKVKGMIFNNIFEPLCKEKIVLTSKHKNITFQPKMSEMDSYYTK